MEINQVLIVAGALFSLQLALCFISKKRIIRLFPVILVGMVFFVAIGSYCGLLGKGDNGIGVIQAHHLVGAIFAIAGLVWAVAVALAWLCYRVILSLRNRNDFNENYFDE